MDGDRFDLLARRFAAGTTRRTLLRALAGGAASLLSLGGVKQALGQSCRAAGGLCTKDAHCCSGLCDSANGDPAKRNRCVCPSGQENCKGTCKTAPADYLSDVLNCGVCGNRCPIDQCNRAICVAGVCGLEPDPKRIGKSCNDLNCCTERDVCQPNGVCAGAQIGCPPPRVCEDPGTCNPATCQCDYPFKPSTIVCRDSAGQCDVAENCTGSSPDCPVNQFRPNGFGCETGNLCTGDICDGAGNCVEGPVNVTCPACRACLNGACTVVSADNTSCGDGQKCCGDNCINVATDVRNRGSCGYHCSVNETCIDGTCYCGEALGCGETDADSHIAGICCTETILDTTTTKCFRPCLLDLNLDEITRVSPIRPDCRAPYSGPISDDACPDGQTLCPPNPERMMCQTSAIPLETSSVCCPTGTTCTHDNIWLCRLD